jgi:hypothetical protein
MIAPGSSLQAIFASLKNRHSWGLPSENPQEEIT